MKSTFRRSLFHSHSCALLCLQVCTLSGAALWAQAPAHSDRIKYKVTDICTPLGASGGSDINDKGQVVGVALAADNSWHPYLWKDGHTTELPAGITPVRINNIGQVLANKYDDATGASIKSFVWQNGRLTDLGSLGGSYVWGLDINDKGQVVGYSGTAVNNLPHAFLWQNGTITDISGLDRAEPLVYAAGINDHGDIAAGIYNANFQQNGLLLSDGKQKNLGYAPGGWDTLPSRINTNKEVIGRSEGGSESFRHAFLWRDGRMTDLGTLRGAAKTPCGGSAFTNCASYAEAINNAGQVVGASDVPSSGSSGDLQHAVLWQDGHIMDLNNLIPAASGWYLNDASGINSQGQIVGGGDNSRYPGCTFLLTPKHAVDATLQLSVPSSRFAAHPVGQATGPATIWIHNSGPDAADFNTIQFAGADPHDFAITENTCGSVIAPLATCKVAFHFKPVAEGERTASLTIDDNAKDGPHAIPVQGFGSSK